MTSNLCFPSTNFSSFRGSAISANAGKPHFSNFRSSAISANSAKTKFQQVPQFSNFSKFSEHQLSATSAVQQVQQISKKQMFQKCFSACSSEFHIQLQLMFSNCSAIFSLCSATVSRILYKTQHLFSDASAEFDCIEIQISAMFSNCSADSSAKHQLTFNSAKFQATLLLTVT